MVKFGKQVVREYLATRVSVLAGKKKKKYVFIALKRLTYNYNVVHGIISVSVRQLSFMY